MAIRVGNRIKETTTASAGTDPILQLSGAPTGFQTFASGVGAGSIVHYMITDNVNWEFGFGTISASGDSLQRDTVLNSSNNDQGVNWDSSPKDVFSTIGCSNLADGGPVNLDQTYVRTGRLDAIWDDTDDFALTFLNNRQALMTGKRGHTRMGVTGNQMAFPWDGAGIDHVQGWVFQNGGVDPDYRPNFAFVIGRARTTNATQTELGANGNTEDQAATPTTKMGIGDNNIQYWVCEVLGKRESSTDYSVWTLNFVATRGTSAATIDVTALTVTQLAHRNGGSWNVTAKADTTNGRPQILVTGSAANNIRWSAVCKVSRLS